MLGANRVPLRPIESISNLPSYAAIFFAQQSYGFRLSFALLTLASVLTSALGFYTAYLLGQVISSLPDISENTLWSVYLVWYIAALLLREGLGFLIRRYGEAFSTVYADHLRLRFLQTFQTANFVRVQNVLPERFMALVSKYVGHVEAFLSDWFWGASMRVTALALILTTLAWQNWLVFISNLIFMLLFLALALSISRRFAPVAARYSETTIEASALIGNLSNHIPSLIRLGNFSYFVNLARAETSRKWEKLEAVRKFHARRWLFQLNLFNVMYAGTIFYGAYQVKLRLIPLGFLVILKYAFDRLWEVLVYIVEYYVSLVQQSEDSKIIRRDLSELLPDAAPTLAAIPHDWRTLSLENAEASFLDPRAGSTVRVRVPSLIIKRRDKLGIRGASGTGKTTLLNLLLGLVPYEGAYCCDGESMRGRTWSPNEVALISGNDPLFRGTIRDNILMGRPERRDKLSLLAASLGVAEFCQNFDLRFGDDTLNFSAGQLQRLRLLRGLYGDEPLVLLDEPFNGIDERTKQRIIEFLRDYLADRTVVLVTHHQSELSLVDFCHFFDRGVLSKERICVRSSQS